MDKRKKLISILAGIMALIMLLGLIAGFIPTAHAAHSSELKAELDALKEEKAVIDAEIKKIKGQITDNNDDMKAMVEQKNLIDQEVFLLNQQIINLNNQIAEYGFLIADKQDELDVAETRYAVLNEENKTRIRTMEEEGELSYWEVLFKANSFSDLLDRLNIVEEIAASDNRRLKELSAAADEVEVARGELISEKEEMELAKQELDAAEAEMDAKRAEADAIIQELLEKADDLEALEAEFEAQEAEFLEMIAQKEHEYDEAKQREWEAYMATYVPPTTAPVAGSTNNSTATNSGTTSSGGSGGSSAGGWVVPCSYTSITSPFGYRTAPTTGASTYHQGVDLDTGTGWPVVATRAGTAYTGYGSAAGNYITVDHHDGFKSIYMHLNGFAVGNGTNVSAGQLIGYTGSTGVSTGDHLHFGISLNGVYVNPCSYVPL